MKILRVCLIVLLTIVTFDFANATSLQNFDRRDREWRRHEHWERRHHREERFRHGHVGEHDYHDRY